MNIRSGSRLGASSLCYASLAAAQGGNMMNDGYGGMGSGWMGGYGGGIWLPLLLVAVVVGLVVWVVKQKGK